MAGYIKGITIEFGADTTKLNSALKQTQGSLNKTQSELKQVNNALKFNPGNTTLLKQKFDLLQQSVSGTRAKLKQLEDLQKQMDANDVDKTSAQYRQLEREIVKTKDQLKQAENQARQFGSVAKQKAIEAGNAFKTAGNKIKSVGKTITTTVSVYGMAGIYAGAKLIEMSEKQSQAELKLQSIYKKSMGANKKAAQSTFDYASALQKTGVIGDEVTISGASVLAQYAETPNAVNKMLPALDSYLAKTKGLDATQEDAETAAKMFGKAMTGNYSALEKNGIKLTENQKKMLDNATEEERAAILADIITKKTGNMNEELAKTDAGKIQQAKNALGDMGEEIGAVLLPAVADFVSWMQDNLLPKLQQLINYLKEHPAIAKFALAFAAITAVLGPVIMIIGSLISAIGTIITMAPVIGGALSALAGPVGIVIAAVAAAIAIGVALYKNWDTIKAKLSALKDWFVKIFDAIKTKVTTAFQAVKNAIMKPIQTAVDFVKKMIDKIKSFFTFKVQLPHIKLPHFGIKPKGWKIGDLLKGSIPTLGINWYAKGGIFNNPSVIGVGEAGAEAVLPIDRLNGMMAAMADNIVNGLAMTMATNGAGVGDVTIPIYLYPSGAKMGEEVVKSYDMYKKILG